MCRGNTDRFSRYRSKCPVSLAFLSKQHRHMLARRAFTVRTAVVLLAATAALSIAACGKKGPLYLPDPA
ncbi:MAG TPA: lipoprotein, partial [Burkholderiales bacterium]|nr:lipoprotein [Burkholderiales bacterium]